MRSLIVLIALALYGCGPGSLAAAVRPDEVRADTVIDEDVETTCRDVAATAEPLIVDWKTKRRLDLELAMRQRIAVVAYDCERLVLLPDCQLDGGYSFAGVSRKEDVVQLTNRDELSANLPLSGARLGAGLERGASLDLALVTIGRKASTLAKASRHELRGSCREATHYVRAATVGAFAVEKGTVGEARAVVAMFGAEASGESSSRKRSAKRDGDLTACRAAKPDDGAPPDQCQTPIRLELAPLSEQPIDRRKSAGKGGEMTESNPCPAGMVWRDDKCAVAATDDPHQCAPDDVAGCRSQCQHGHAGSCLNLGVMTLYGAEGVSRDLDRARLLFDKGCEGGNLKACHASGFMNAECQPKTSAGEARGVERAGCRRLDPDKAEAHFRKACDGGYGQSCEALAERVRRGIFGDKDPARVDQLLQRSCDLGFDYGCTTLGEMLLDGVKLPKDVVRAISVLQKSCDANNVLNCGRLAEVYLSGRHISKDVPRAAALLERNCDAGSSFDCGDLASLYELGQGKLDKDPTKAREYYRRSCYPAAKQPVISLGCARYGAMLVKGEGGESDRRLAGEAYDRACTADGHACIDASRFADERAVELLARGCEIRDTAACDALEARAPERAQTIYRAKCKDGQPKSWACQRLQRKPR